MVHVLPEVHSTTYPEVLGDGKEIEGSATDTILDGCFCARCGCRDLRLMRRWVSRWFCLPGEELRLWARLARCLACGARERVLPYDALPSKQAGVQLVFTCLRAVVRHPGATLAHVVDELVQSGIDISRQLLTQWMAGVRDRGDDLFQLLRHRALIAPPGCEPTRRLVPFHQALDAAQAAGLVPLEVRPKDGLLLVLEVVGAFEGVERLARFGAQVFRQAVLLFRSPEVGTPSCMAPALAPG